MDCSLELVYSNYRGFNVEKVNLLSELKNSNYYKKLSEELIEDGNSLDYVSNLNVIYKSDLTNYEWEIPKMARIPRDVPGEYREVFIFNDFDSVLLKIINRILNDKLSGRLSEYVYSYRSGLSVGDVCSSLMAQLNSSNLNYVKTDISKYFNTVPHDVIVSAVKDLIEDEDGVNLMLRLFDISSYVSPEGEVVNEYLGIMPGTATSSFFSNYILSDVDNKLSKEVSVYARYSDDIVMIDASNDVLDDAFSLLSEEISNLGLNLHPNKISFKRDVDCVEFLGLSVTKDYVDVSKKNFEKMKSKVKKICKSARKELELSTSVNPKYHLSRAIGSINKVFYKAYLNDNGSRHRNSTLVFAFNNITTDRTIKELDFYVNDRLRYVVTGVNNSSNVKKVPLSILESCGMVSAVQMFNLYKMSKPSFLLKVTNLSSVPIRRHIPTPVYRYDNPSFQEDVWHKSFFELIRALHKVDGRVYLGKLEYEVRDVRVDFIDKVISLDNKVLVRGDKLIIDFLDVSFKGKFCRVIFPNKSLLVDDVDPSLLVHLYRNSYLDEFESSTNGYRYFPKINRKDFYLNGFREDYNASNVDLFVLYFYCSLVNPSFIDSLDLSKEFVLLGGKLPLVFESKLISKDSIGNSNVWGV